MDSVVFIGITTFLSTILLVVNLYNSTVKKPQESQSELLRATEKALNEFMIAYSGASAEQRMQLQELRQDIDSAFEENRRLNKRIETLEKDLLTHQFKENRGGEGNAR